MEFILNEKSLVGQFIDLDEFWESVQENIQCFKLILRGDTNNIYKVQDFNQCLVTSTERICDLKKYSEDKNVRLQLALDSIIYQSPYWDTEPLQDLSASYFWEGEDVSATAIAEAAVRNVPLLSFFSDKFADTQLNVTSEQNQIRVDSIYSVGYLVQNYSASIKITGIETLKIRYRNTRLDFSLLEKNCGLEKLDKSEYQLLIGSLDKFVKHESFETIAVDDGLEYKKYSPASNRQNYFRGSIHSDKTIMKFRFSGVHRVFGYRKGDKFRVLLFERDHSISDHG